MASVITSHHLKKKKRGLVMLGVSFLRSSKVHEKFKDKIIKKLKLPHVLTKANLTIALLEI
jgi:hypothetical protein